MLRASIDGGKTWMDAPNGVQLNTERAQQVGGSSLTAPPEITEYDWVKRLHRDQTITPQTLRELLAWLKERDDPRASVISKCGLSAEEYEEDKIYLHYSSPAEDCQYTYPDDHDVRVTAKHKQLGKRLALEIAQYLIDS